MKKHLPVVITQVPRQTRQVARLVDYCKRLDGTEITVIPVDDSDFKTPYPGNEFANKQCHSFRKAALAMKGSPFIWIESDSIPLKEGWAAAISSEYKKRGKHFLLPPQPKCPHDVAAGIGVYGQNTHWLIPQDFQRAAWDLWMLKHLGPLIARTPLIQHSYGAYDARGAASDYRFPRDNSVIRPDAVLFHRDKYQDLIPKAAGGKQRFLHTGDLGDVIASLPAVRELGGGDFVVSYSQDGQRESLKGTRFESLKPLLEAQEYVTKVSYEDVPSEITHDFSDFRTGAFQGSLAHWHARHLEVEAEYTPWLEADPDPRYAGRVVVARSARYHNPAFPWRELVARFGSQILFVGSKDEHSAFERTVKQNIEYAPTKDLLGLAQVIAGSSLFIGNQSCPWWIAFALGVKTLQESFPGAPNSQIPRANARYTLQGMDMVRLRQELRNKKAILV